MSLTVALIATGWGLAILLAVIGVVVAMNSTVVRHVHVWSQWEVKSYSGTSVDRWTKSKTPILMREQERRCTECGYTEVEELP